jgi:hypothetical protein
MRTSGDSARFDGGDEIRVSSGPLRPGVRGIGSLLRRARAGNFLKIFGRFALPGLREFLYFVSRVHVDFIDAPRWPKRKLKNASLLYHWL